MADLKVDNVSLVFGKDKETQVRALDQINLEVPSSQFAVLVGPSGCGKSTLLRLVAGLHAPSEGELTLGGEPIRGPGSDRGMVFQSYTLFPWLSVRKNIEFGLRLAKKSASECKELSDFYLEETGLSKFADAFPKQLSGGMKQRVAIARALANDPRILLMDEPFGALDSQTRGLMQELITKIWSDTNKQILFVTHDIEEAVFVGQRIYIMSARPGRIKEVVDVDIDYPRTIDTLSDPRFVEARQHVLNSIREEVMKAHNLT